MTFARDLWLRLETIHAVTYFGEETVARAISTSGVIRYPNPMGLPPLN